MEDMVSFCKWEERRSGIWGGFKFEMPIISRERDDYKNTLNLLDTP